MLGIKGRLGGADGRSHPNESRSPRCGPRAPGTLKSSRWASWWTTRAWPSCGGGGAGQGCRAVPDRRPPGGSSTTSSSTCPGTGDIQMASPASSPGRAPRRATPALAAQKCRPGGRHGRRSYLKVAGVVENMSASPATTARRTRVRLRAGSLAGGRARRCWRIRSSRGWRPGRHRLAAGAGEPQSRRAGVPPAGPPAGTEIMPPWRWPAGTAGSCRRHPTWPPSMPPGGAGDSERGARLSQATPPSAAALDPVEQPAKPRRSSCFWNSARSRDRRVHDVLRLVEQGGGRLVEAFGAAGRGRAAAGRSSATSAGGA